MTEEQALSSGFKVKVGRFSFQASGKAMAVGDTVGFVKLIFDEKYGELLGAHIVGSEATEMIAELGMAKALEGTWDDLSMTVHAHPTLSEAIMEAAMDAQGHSYINDNSQSKQPRSKFWILVKTIQGCMESSKRMQLKRI
ncbi:MAG: hypothetical protein CM15mP64_3430 [Candidatus Neomarinimicrobiota bacterium]|nr:MAG: hypothetical protein CM15mP64_3430 [Candidatus Neomarinimicrobiota bacterium]